jgi:hypothetical protein
MGRSGSPPASDAELLGAIHALVVNLPVSAVSTPETD